MQCPRDGDDLYTTRYAGAIELDRCPTCHGVWLDKGELQAILRAVQARDTTGERPDVVGNAFLMGQDRDADLSCPRCGAELDHTEYAVASQVMIDRCPEGCGLWLDAGELHRLEVFFDQSHDSSRELGFAELWRALVGAVEGASR